MARDNVAITSLPVNAGTAAAAGVAINPANGAVVATGGFMGRLLLYVMVTNAGGGNVTVKKGVNPPAFRSGLGDLAISFAQNDEKYIVVESARFAQANGDLYLDFDAGLTGVVAAYALAEDA